MPRRKRQPINNMMRFDRGVESGRAIEKLNRTVEQLWKKSLGHDKDIDLLQNPIQNITNEELLKVIREKTPISWTYASATIREAATGFTSSDKKKFAHQTDNDSIWMLKSINPTVWAAVETDKPHRDYIDFDETSSTVAERRLQWDDNDGTLQVGMPGGEVNQQIGLEGLRRCINKTGVTIPNGKYVYANGAQGNRLTIALTDNTDADKIYMLGMTTEDIPNNQSGYVALWGDVRGSTDQPIDTSSCPEGAKLYLSTGGGFTNIHPSGSTDAVVIVGRVRTSHATDGVVAVDRPQSFTIGNSFNGTMRQGVINKNAGSGAAVGFTVVNDANHRATFGLGGSNNAAFPNNTVLYGEGYNDNLYAVDGAKSHKFFTDPTDSHDNSSLGYLGFEIASGGRLWARTPNYETLVTYDDVIPNKKWVDDVISGDIICTSLTATTFVSGASGYFGTVSGATGKFGSGANYSEFEETGTLVYNGEATTWRDINVGGVSLSRAAANRPDLVTIDSTNILTYAFDGNASTEELHGSFEMQHDYKEGTAVYPHIHWYPTDTDSGNVVWFGEYWIRKANEFLASGTLSATHSTGNVAWEERRVNFTPNLDGVGLEIATQVHVRLYRDPTFSGDTYGSDAAIATFGLHYETDTTGSRQITTK